MRRDRVRSESSRTRGPNVPLNPVVLINAVLSWRSGEIAGDNPWKSSGLEWATTSPPPSYNFAFPLIVHDRHPLWATTVEHEVVVPVRRALRLVEPLRHRLFDLTQASRSFAAVTVT